MIYRQRKKFRNLDNKFTKTQKRNKITTSSGNRDFPNFHEVSRVEDRRPINTRHEHRGFFDEESYDGLEGDSGFSNNQMSSLRSELFNINKRLNHNNNLSYQNSRQNTSNAIGFESTDRGMVTRPSTNGFVGLEPIDHEKSKQKLKELLQKQLQAATGFERFEIERRLAEIDHPKYVIQNTESLREKDFQ